MSLKKKIKDLKVKIGENSEKVIAVASTVTTIVAVSFAAYYKQQLELEKVRSKEDRDRIGFADWVSEQIVDGKDHLIYTDKENPKIVYISDSLEEDSEE